MIFLLLRRLSKVTNGDQAPMGKMVREKVIMERKIRRRGKVGVQQFEEGRTEAIREQVFYLTVIEGLTVRWKLTSRMSRSVIAE